MFGLPFAFAAPALLTGLVVLPVIWWLLRLTPPRPQTEVFPPLRILQRLIKNEETPAKSPWWLTLLRLIVTALIIFALARPLLNPQDQLALDDGPLLILVDNSWASAIDWPARQRTGNAIIQQAGEQGKPVAISPTVAAPNAAVSLMDAATAAAAFAALEPISAGPDRQTALAKLIETAEETENATLAVLSDGIGADNDAETFALLNNSAISKTLHFGGDTTTIAAINEARNRADTLEATLTKSPEATLDGPVTVSAVDERGRLLATTQALFVDGSNEAVASFEVPFELRNDMSVLRIAEQSHAGSAYLLDESNRRRRIALFSGRAGDEAQPLLSPLYYIARAIEDFADIVRPESNDLSVEIPKTLDLGPAVIVMADIGVLPNAVEEQVGQWIEAGGTLVRFAGPRLAASSNDDPFLPVRLRSGERELGGALTWTEPQVVAAFPPNGPFASLNAPVDVSVNRQLLAEPDSELANKTWASLADGTPLVTGERRGKGAVVLFHVTAEATWSNLPISGSFVDMLRRLADIASNTGAATGVSSGNIGQTAQTLAPQRILRSDGELIAPPAFVKPLEPAEAFTASYENPAGTYGEPEAFTAINILEPNTTISTFQMPPLTIENTELDYSVGEQRDLSGWFFVAAFLLLIVDSIAMLWIGGKLKNLAGGAKRAAGATALLAATVIIATPQSASAQDIKDGDDQIIESLTQTRIGYVLTGVASTDAVTEAGISGISRFIATRTAFEPGTPVGLDISVDELSLYPLIYFPIDASADMPSPIAVARLDAYMQGGGTVLFDTRDEIGAALNQSQTPENARLRAILRDLNIPALEPVPEDHVLTKSFYILDNFPGLYDGSPLWVQASPDENDDRPVRRGDGVSPVIITGNDLAAAWALDEAGRPLRAVVSGNPLQRIYAFRSGVNIMMYMLTGNYKADQVHIPALLERLGQ